jgi:hypothetical protein
MEVSVGIGKIKYVSLECIRNFDFISYAKGFSDTALEGNSDYLGKRFDLGFKPKAEMLSVLHFGYHKNIKENLLWG